MLKDCRREREIHNDRLHIDDIKKVKSKCDGECWFLKISNAVLPIKNKTWGFFCGNLQFLELIQLANLFLCFKEIIIKKNYSMHYQCIVDLLSRPQGSVHLFVLFLFIWFLTYLHNPQVVLEIWVFM